jgi:hypothetical protein
MRKILSLIGIVAISLPSSPADSADNGIYLGGSIGQSGVEFEEAIDGFDADFDSSATAFKLIAGWRFLDWLSVEGNYVDLGTADDKVLGEKLESDVTGVSVSAVGFLPIGPVDLFARIGALNWDAKLEAPALDLRGDDDGTDLTYGVGAQFRVWSLSIRGEYEVFDIDGADSVDLFSVGVTWTFL